jgi:chromosome partitioning protein
MRGNMNALSDRLLRFVLPDAQPTGDRHARVVAVTAQKGGVGKTTTAVALATGLALEQGRRVLLVDLDPQAHCASALHAELGPGGTGGEPLGAVLLGKRRDVHEVAYATAIDGLWVTPSDRGLGETEAVMAGRMGKELLLRAALRVARTHYDVIVVDCPPNLGALTLNGLAAADWALVPCDMSPLSLEGLVNTFETLDAMAETLQHRVRILGVVRTRYDARSHKANEAVETTLRTRFGPYLLETRIPVNARIGQAQHAGRALLRFDPRCAGARAYRELVADVARRIG